MLVATFGAPLKILLDTAAIAYLLAIFPIAMVVVFIASPILYVTDYKELTKKIFEMLLGTFTAALGIILTTIISNLNPIFLFKTLAIDPVLCVMAINNINTNVKNSVQIPSPAQKYSPARMSSRLLRLSYESNITNIRKEPVAEIIAKFNENQDITSDAIINAIKVFGSGFMFNRQFATWSPRNPTRIDIVFNISRLNETNTLAVLQAKTMANNIINLQFTDKCDDHDQALIAVGFTKMVKSIASLTNSYAPPTLDISDCPAASEEIIKTNMRELDNVDIVFVDRKLESVSSTPDTINFKNKVALV